MIAVIIERERDRDRDRDRQTERERQRETDRETERVGRTFLKSIMQCLSKYYENVIEAFLTHF